MFVQRKGRVSIHLGTCGVPASAAAHLAAACPAIAAAYLGQAAALPGRAFAAVAGKAFAAAYPGQAAACLDQGTGTAAN